MGYAQRMGLGQIAPPDSAMEEVVEQQRIRELAATIRDEAHLQQILDDVSPQSIRAEVEAAIRPWCAFTPIITITPTDPADAEPAALLQAVISHEVLEREIADCIQPGEFITILEYDCILKPADPDEFARSAFRIDDLADPIE